MNYSLHVVLIFRVSAYFQMGLPLSLKNKHGLSKLKIIHKSEQIWPKNCEIGWKWDVEVICEWQQSYFVKKVSYVLI